MPAYTDHPHHYFSDYTIKWATLNWEIQQAYSLRRQVFCDEQALFEGSDRDAADERSHLLVAVGGYGGWHEEVIGTVRITELEPGVWKGSRLAVNPEFRRQGLVGPTLIRLAVSSAHGLGCHRFIAQVQKQNERLFQKLNWDSVGDEMILGHLHTNMVAQLQHYPPCLTPTSGFVVSGVHPAPADELAPCLTSLHTVPSLAAGLQ